MCNAYPDVIFALDDKCTAILRSCDQGQHWEVYAKPGWRFKYFDSLPTFAADPHNPDKVYTLDSTHDLASYDGEKWTAFNVMDHVEMDISYDYIRNVAVDPNDPDIIYAGMFASGGSTVMRTLDGGETWEDISYNLSRIGGALKVNPHTGELYKGSLFGTWIFPAPYEKIPSPEIEENIFGIMIDQDTLELMAGDSQVLHLEFTMSCLSNIDLVWSSSDTSVAKVSDSGEVTAEAAGNCMITVKNESKDISADCKIIVEPNPVAIRSGMSPSFNAFTASNNQLFVTFPDEVMLSNMKLYNLLGEVVFVQTFNGRYVRQTEMDISTLSDGFYILSIATISGSGTQKILLSR